jgi:hypothetical protein
MLVNPETLPGRALLSPYELAIVLPTFNRVGNEPILAKIEAALPDTA